MGFFTGPDGEQKVAQLLEHVKSGLSFSDIARLMGAPSRNTVLGKFSRLRKRDPSIDAPIVNRKNFGPVRVVERSNVVVLKPKPKPEPPKELEPLKLEDGSFVTDETIDNRMCRYPIGDPDNEEFHYCGHSKKIGSSYCEAHHVKCYQPRQQRTKDHVGRRRA